MAAPLPTGTVTFLFSDVEGSTRLVGHLGAARYGQILARHHRMLRKAFGSHGGVERGTEGDSFFVVFTEAAAAVAAAVSAQRALANTEWPAASALRVRMGLHTGSAQRGGDDYVGLDVNRAARIASSGHGGQVLISDTTRSLVERDLPPGVTLRDLGEHRLKDLARAERIYQLVIDDLQTEFPALATQRAPSGNIPQRPTTFVGRQPEMDEVRRLIAAARLVTLTGTGGTGKTSVAVEVAREIADAYPDGAWFVPLDAIAQPELVPSAVVAALGLTDAGLRLPMARLKDHLRDRTALLVLDNFEHVLPAAPVVADLLSAAPSLRILVTSRVPLHVSAEQEYAVAPLAVPEATTAADVSAVRDVDSVRLFVDRARRVQPSFSLTDANAVAIVDICRRLDGLPLAIELAASRVKAFSPRVLATRLTDRLAVLTGGAADMPARQRTLRATIDWSYRLLDPPEQQLLDRLSVFAGGWTVEAAEAICHLDLEAAVDVLDATAALVDKSLVRPGESDDDESRYALLETIREYAAARLRDRGEETAIRDRHATHFVALAEAAESRLVAADRAVWAARLHRDLDNLRAALEWTIDKPDPDTGLRIASAMWRFWQQRGHLQEGRAIVDRLLRFPDAQPALRIRGYWAAGGLAYWQDDFEAATTAYESGLALARRLGDRDAEIEGLSNVGYAQMMAGAAEAAKEFFVQSRQLAVELDRPERAAAVDVALSMVHFEAGDYDASIKSAEEALRVIASGSNRLLVSYASSMIGQAYRVKGDLRASARYHLDSLDWRTPDDLPIMARTLVVIAAWAVAAGEHADALRLWGASMAIAEAIHIAPPWGAMRVTGVVEAARARLGDAAADAALDEGRRLAPEDALGLGEALLRTERSGA